LFGLCLSDVIDVDVQQHQRRFELLYAFTLLIFTKMIDWLINGAF